ncbi:MAG: hypothetical protein [Microvirus sp.]|nr:MAG: hypothetical protein [Microvirus sp.]
MDVFDIYFSVIAGFQYHPANPAHNRMPLEECAQVALECIRIRNQLLGER